MAEEAAMDLWIGLNARQQDGFYWTDGKPRSYTNWGYSVSTQSIFTNCNVNLNKAKLWSNSVLPINPV